MIRHRGRHRLRWPIELTGADTGFRKVVEGEGGGGPGNYNY